MFLRKASELKYSDSRQKKWAFCFLGQWSCPNVRANRLFKSKDPYLEYSAISSSDSRERHSGDTLTLKKWLITMVTDFKT